MKLKVGVLGLGYVGLPLAVELSKIKKVVGYDINSKRIIDLNKNIDHNKEISRTKLKKSKKNLLLTSDVNDLVSCNFYIVTVPTPVNQRKEPDLSLLKSATKVVAHTLKKSDIVVFESTVYPGVT
jgi:UDP-N-acetyl-D-galactosamine dehydrogenase